MNGHSFHLAGETLTALPSGALWWSARRLLCVSDLHLGKSERMARRGGAMLPPYEGLDTLLRLEEDIAAQNPDAIVCLGDSFDDLTAADRLDADLVGRIATLMAGRRWIWIEGNHDAGPVDLGGSHMAVLHMEPLTFRHIATRGESGEISGHYHPKARVATRARQISRPCFLRDADRLILPAYGTYTGGLESHHDTLSSLMGANAEAILLTNPPLAVPMPR